MKHFSVIFFIILLSILVSSSFAQINWIKDTLNNPILECGESGSWDELYVQHSSIVFDGNNYHMWYLAYIANTNDWSIGHATSHDGIIWEKDSLNNPVLRKGSIGSWDSDYVAGHSVIYDDSIFHMWYTGAYPPNTNLKIGYAWSSDGINWTKYDDTTTTSILYAESDPVLIPGSQGSWDENIVEVPAVILESNSYTMWYLGMNNSFTAGLGRATSPDGITWTKEPQNHPVLTPDSPNSWDYPYLRLGSVIFDGIRYHKFYYGGEFYMDFRIGYAWSSDGINWTKYNNPATTDPAFNLSDPVLTCGPVGSWDDTQVMDPCVIKESDTLKMWYTGADNVNTPSVVTAIGYAIAPFDTSILSVNFINDNFPNDYVLNQNYPNPFNPATTIEFSIPKTEFVTLKVYNILGEEVATLVSEKLTAGRYTYTCDAGSLASGVYLYKFQTSDYIETKKMILLR